MTSFQNDGEIDQTNLARSWSRFSLRMMFAAVTAMAVLLYLLISAPAIVAAPALYLLNMLLMMFFLAGSLYAGENLKAFCRGAILPWFAYYLFLTFAEFSIVNVESVDLYEIAAAFGEAIGFFRFTTIFFGSTSLITGATTVAFKRLLEPSNRRYP